MKPHTDLLERLCRCLAVHTAESELTVEFTEPRYVELDEHIAEAKRLMVEAGHDFDSLYPPTARPTANAGPCEARSCADDDVQPQQLPGLLLPEGPGRRIERAWLADDSLPATWRSGDTGETLTRCLSTWLAGLGDELPLWPDALDRLSQGMAVGWVEPCAHSGDGGVAFLTGQAMAAFVAEAGLCAATVSMLHHALSELVGSGVVRPCTELRQVPGLGLLELYVIDRMALDSLVAGQAEGA